MSVARAYFPTLQDVRFDEALISCNLVAVLKRDGTNVVVGSNCAATSGSWVSPFDNVATNLASDLDIVSDVVPRQFYGC